MMIDPVTKGPHTYHTTNPVPFILVDETQRMLRSRRRAAGYLADRAGIPGRKAAQGNDRPRPPSVTGLSFREKPRSSVKKLQFQ